MSPTDETAPEARPGASAVDAPRQQGVWRGAVLVAVVAWLVGLAVRVPYLGAMPTPAHDEGNWGLVAWRIYTGRGANMPADARFVSALFAWLEALAYRLSGGPSFAAGRAVLVTAVLAGALVAFAQCARLRLYRAGAALVALFAVHPWSVLFSRVTPAPYPISLVLGVSASLFALSVFTKPREEPVSRARVWFLTVLLGQLFALGFHFTPLAALPALATGLWVLVDRERRARVHLAAALASVALALAHIAPIAREALRVAARGSTRPSAPFEFFGVRLENYLRVCVGGLTGESSVRDFTNVALGPFGEKLSGLVALVVLAYALAPQSRSAAPGLAGASPVRALRSLAACNLATAFFGMPVLLLPARQWYLGAVDAERYLFVVLVPAALALAALAERSRRGLAVALLACVYLFAGPTARTARYFLTQGGPDLGLPVSLGGAAGRRWKVAREREPLPVLLRREAERAARETGVRPVFVINDYTLHPLYFANAGDGYEVLQPRADGSLAPRPGMLHVFVRWSDGVFAPNFDPAYMVRDNEHITALMHGPGFETLRLLRRFVQPDGSPLLELWSARARRE